MRKVNMELFRIVTMIMIVLIHFLVHGGIIAAAEQFSIQYYVLWTLCSICYVSVNGYVLLTGYFQYESKFKLKKIILLMAEVLFYSVAIYAILYFTGNVELNATDLSLSLLPTINRAYWFTTNYVGLYVLSPFFNWVLKRINKKQHTLLLVVLITFFSVWPTFSVLSTGLNLGGPFGTDWFAVLYCIGAYFRKYYVVKKEKIKLIVGYVLTAIALPMSKFVIAKFVEKTSITLIPDDMFFYYNSILVLISSVLLFLIFLNIEIKNKYAKVLIGFFAPATLGVYLIHDNLFGRVWLWNTLKVHQYIQNEKLYLIMAGIVMGIYLGCSLIDKVRHLLFKRLGESKWLEDICKNIEQFFMKVYLTFDE